MRFVILHHVLPPDSGRADHFDLMLERDADGPLLTWELPELPQFHSEYAARQLPPHRREYLDYEGPVSGDRGHVTRKARGTCEWIEPTVVKLTSETLNAVVTIESGAGDICRLTFRP
jgi:hypothetical protein